eukprot:CAMPEP_0180534498 /NCGR_PEP_ID=MMETSP1036_2-20121128/64212_1 /TAXON_ID=632150 /ORGANISM="Azadinium spinosum, Strain 3D9" /LENGTH=35 /DNA_ID= /DNA_START= /DNA_END= /DNA_ORIENTATION=
MCQLLKRNSLTLFTNIEPFVSCAFPGAAPDQSRKW